MNYPILSLIFYEYDKKAIAKVLNTEVELSDIEKEDLLDRAIKHVQKELVKLGLKNNVPKREGN